MFEYKLKICGEYAKVSRITKYLQYPRVHCGIIRHYCIKFRLHYEWYLLQAWCQETVVFDKG